MKAMMKTIEMLAWFDEEGNPHPIRFRLNKSEDEKIIVKIDKVLNQESVKFGGNVVIRFDCRASSEMKCHSVRLNYEIGSCKWYLAGI